MGGGHGLLLFSCFNCYEGSGGMGTWPILFSYQYIAELAFNIIIDKINLLQNQAWHTTGTHNGDR